MKITEPRINDYIQDLLPTQDRILTQMELLAKQNGFPIIGPLVGPILRQLAVISGAKRIFEMGSGYGYSAYWFAGGMRNGGKILCTDSSEDNRKKAMSYLKRGGYDSMIDFRVGDALEIISQQDGPFDIIFNDIDKEGYPEAFDLAIPRLRSGGLFIADNVLWSGRILSKKPDSSTQAILEFNRKLFKSKNLLSSILPIRDGVAVAVKL
jgi:caffeoyl-CoA O-methyltransferase